MKTRKYLLSVIGAIAFMVILALNVHLVNDSSSKNMDGLVSLSMIEQEAQAGGEGTWSQVCCGSMCQGGPHCLGNGTYLCCKP